MKHPIPPTKSVELLAELLKRTLPHLEAAEASYLGHPEHRKALAEVIVLNMKIVDELLARDIKPFDEYENPAEAVTDENELDDRAGTFKPVCRACGADLSRESHTRWCDSGELVEYIRVED